MRATRRRTARHKASSVPSRGAVWCGTHAGADFVVTVVACGSSPASRVLAWCSRGVFWLRLHRRHCVPPPLRGRCSMLTTCARGVCWRRFASPSPLRSSPVGRGRPPSRTLRALTTRSSRTRIPRSPQRITRYRYALGSLSMRELASLRSAVPAVRDGGVLAGGSRRVSAWVWYRHAFAAEPLRIVTKNQSGAGAIGRRKRRSAKGRLGVREADLPACRVSRMEERSDSANMAPKVA